MKRLTTIGLAVLGPLSVGLLRLLLPYYTEPDSVTSARAVAAHPGRESAVLWLGLIATVTLVPGLFAVRDRLDPARLRTWSFALTTVGYLVLPVLLVGDAVLWAGQHEGIGSTMTGHLFDSLHPSYDVGLGVFVLAHVVGTTLIGVLCLRQRRLPILLAWALTISQPLHFTATVVLGSPQTDFVAWALTALAMGALAYLPPAPAGAHG